MPRLPPAPRAAPARHRGAALPPATARSMSQPPPAAVVQRADAPPVAPHRPCSAIRRATAPQAVTSSATRAASASARSGRILPTSRPPAVVPGVSRRRPRHRQRGGGRPSPAPAAAACEGGRRQAEGVHVREWRPGQGRRRSLPLEADVAFVLSGVGASLAGIVAVPRRRFVRGSRRGALIPLGV